MRSVLFVCTANQCRSPMAAALFQQEVVQHGEMGQWKIVSAGTWAKPGLSATSLAQATLARRQIDLAGHRSQSVSAELLQAADVILVMTRNHQEALRAEFPDVAQHIHVLSQLIDQTYDIEDPYDGTSDDYEMCVTEIENILTNGWARLVEWTNQVVSARS